MLMLMLMLMLMMMMMLMLMKMKIMIMTPMLYVSTFLNCYETIVFKNDDLL